MSGSFNVGPGVMISREGLERTGLIRLGSRASNRLLLKLHPGAPPVTDVRDDLKKVFPDALDHRFPRNEPKYRARAGSSDNVPESRQPDCAHRRRDRRIDRDARPPAAEDGHHRDTEEPRRAIGQVVRIYLIQTALLGLCGGIAGVVVGMGVQRIFPELIERYFNMRPETWFSPSSAMQGLLVGMLTTLLFTLASAAEHPQDQACADSASRHGRYAAGLASETRRSAIRASGRAVVICLGLAGIAGVA